MPPKIKPGPDPTFDATRAQGSVGLGQRTTGNVSPQPAAITQGAGLTESDTERARKGKRVIQTPTGFTTVDD